MVVHAVASGVQELPLQGYPRQPSRVPIIIICPHNISDACASLTYRCSSAICRPDANTRAHKLSLKTNHGELQHLAGNSCSCRAKTSAVRHSQRLCEPGVTVAKSTAVQFPSAALLPKTRTHTHKKETLFEIQTRDNCTSRPGTAAATKPSRVSCALTMP